MPRYKSKAYCEGDKMNPRIPGQTLSVCMPIKLKNKIENYTQKKGVSISAWVREIIKREIKSC